MLGNKCDSLACEEGQVPSINVEYWFPLGFCWSQIVRLKLTYETTVGPSLQLSTLRRVSDSTQCVSFALNGNIHGLKALFSQGLASPRDVSSTNGYSLLRWALYGQQYEMCKSLMTVGADPTYRPIAQSDDCPSDEAGDIIPRGGLPPEVMEILRIISEGSDFIEHQNFSLLHRIVLDDIFSTLKSVANAESSFDSRMESGLLSPFEAFQIADSDLDSDLLVFEDAKEFLYSPTDFRSPYCPSVELKKRATL
ncbi:hypothetical protein QBC46DRAFT_344486 [Diplogelasinospora grovesii]|uniref:Ankyrin repeat protein n=1 Tax=Diplogelasinospora grovesii TaxID=303347 RepID=A0AAN6N2C1_9PEZI|nr:hypothetical protein QBC46DRAFT_344486 [Diplogelasinospora grovesii]